jgi:hypothetical protein
MSTKKDHTIVAVQIEEEDRWNREVLPHLPQELAAAANQHKAFIRKRAVPNAQMLLRAILGYVLGGMATREWGAWAVLMGIADISDTAWRKRLRRASSWLLWLFNALVGVPAETAKQLPGGSQRILFIDATRLRIPGGSGDDVRLHSCYELISARFAEITVTDWQEGEQLDHYHLRPGDMVLTDAGYGIRRNLSQVIKHQAFAVLRIFPTTFPVEDLQGKPINLFDWLRQPGEAIRECAVFFVDADGERHAVRVVAGELPPEQAALARCRKRKAAQKHGRTISEDTLLAAGWVILVTNLPGDTWAAEVLLRLYRARWQIELVFKRMKQILHLNQLRCHHWDSIQATVLALLVAWALQEQEVAQIRQCLQQLLTHPLNRVVSTWTLTKLSLATLRQQVLGQWSQARFDEVLPALLRFLTSAKRIDRVHQETAIRNWLQNRFSPSALSSGALP